MFIGKSEKLRAHTPKFRAGIGMLVFPTSQAALFRCASSSRRRGTWTSSTTTRSRRARRRSSTRSRRTSPGFCAVTRALFFRSGEAEFPSLLGLRASTDIHRVPSSGRAIQSANSLGGRGVATIRDEVRKIFWRSSDFEIVLTSPSHFAQVKNSGIGTPAHIAATSRDSCPSAWDLAIGAIRLRGCLAGDFMHPGSTTTSGPRSTPSHIRAIVV